MKTNLGLVFGFFLAFLLLTACSNQQDGQVCLDADADGSPIDATDLELTDTQQDAIFSCSPLVAELDCDDANASINPAISEETETTSDLNCNDLINGSTSSTAEPALAAEITCVATSTIDTDVDGITNECDTDDDGDGVEDNFDNCIYTPNLGQEKAPSVENGLGDACQPAVDADAEGIADAYDNCVNTINVDQTDTDDDGFGDVCDGDPSDPEVGAIVEETVTPPAEGRPEHRDTLTPPPTPPRGEMLELLGDGLLILR